MTSSADAYSNSALVYDSDYPFLHYSGHASHNDVARLEKEMASGKVKLAFHPPRGYLDSLLKALKISPTSQVMVFSKTSLQSTIIGPASPRAIYFNDDDYVAWIDHTPTIEINVMDSALGPVFYTMDEISAQPAHFERQTLVCLACHDTFSLQGGGVPNFLFLSAYRIEGKEVDTDTVAVKTDNSTPMVERWGGWYVTGKFGGMLDLGNILPPANGTLVPLSSVSRANVPSVDRFFDARAYPTDKSDVVAILVLQSQIGVHNLIIHANYKSRWLLEQQSPGSSTKNLSWQDLSPAMQKHFVTLLEPLVRGMLFLGAAKLPAPIQGTSGYEKWFQSRGPF
ncbi:MAG: hypothetical protein ACRETB_11780, partial [Steroidobacteraceae bacterium]